MRLSAEQLSARALGLEIVGHASAISILAAAAAGLGVAYLPDCLTYEHVTPGALVPIMTRFPPPPAGAYVVRPPGQHPAQKIRMLAELLIECTGS
jgi:DNA-binding transcriptional LysR family regulator